MASISGDTVIFIMKYMLSKQCILAAAKRVQGKDKGSGTGSKIEDLTTHKRTSQLCFV